MSIERESRSNRETSRRTKMWNYGLEPVMKPNNPWFKTSNRLLFRSLQLKKRKGQTLKPE